MDFSNIRLLTLLKSRMDFDSQNIQVLSKNIANVDTPGYQAEEIRKNAFEKALSGHTGSLAMATTSGAHMHGAHANQDFREGKNKSTYETRPTKNNVNLEQQMADVAYTNVNYSTMTDLYRKTASMFKTAIGQH